MRYRRIKLGARTPRPVSAYYLRFLYSPPARRFEKRREAFSISGWGQTNRSTAIDTASRTFQTRETSSDPAFLVKDPDLNGGYGYGGTLREQQIVRANQAVEAEAGLLNAQRGRGAN